MMHFWRVILVSFSIIILRLVSRVMMLLLANKLIERVGRLRHLIDIVIVLVYEVVRSAFSSRGLIKLRCSDKTFKRVVIS